MPKIATEPVYVLFLVVAFVFGTIYETAELS